MEHIDQTQMERVKALIPLLILFILLCLFIAIVFALGAACIALFRERKRLLDAKHKTVASYATDGVILDARLVQDQSTPASPLHNKYSILYSDSTGVQHRAFIGIDSNVPLKYTIDDTVQLHLFQQSVIVPDARAFDPNRGQNGKIDCAISFRKWLNKPIDETGTVMLEQDYLELEQEIERNLSSRQKLGWLMIFLSAVSFLITFGIVFELFTTNWS